jgi:tetratricopeptide (TPR) repeat protein
VDLTITHLQSLAAAGGEQGSAPQMAPGLACIVDFSGLRFFAMLMPPVDERSTLLHGVHDELRIFLNADPAVERQLSALGAAMNLSPHTWHAFNKGKVAVPLGVDVQVHKGLDEKLHILNLSRVFPADLPSPASSHIVTDLLRPEFIQGLAHPISADAYRKEVEDEPESTVQEAHVAEASVRLRRVTLCEVARSLEALEEAPYDSPTLTACLHRWGINLRHAGRLFQECPALHIQALLAVEAVARACKHIFGQVQRASLRKSRGESLVAEARGRSNDANFVEHNRTQQTRLRAQVVDFLNLVLGASPASDSLWKDSIIPSVSGHFGLTLPPCPQKTFLHMPQLLLALSFHLNVAFRDPGHVDFKAESPITLDMLGDCEPRVKWHPTVHNIGLREALDAEYLMAEGRYAEALRAFAVVLCLVHHWQSHQADQTERARVLVNMAYCQFQLGDAPGAVSLCREAALGCPPLSALEGRLQMLLMWGSFKLGQQAEALEAFERSCSALCFAVGRRHPLYSDLHRILGDLYFQEKAYDRAFVALSEALASASASLTDSHPLCAGLSHKLGILAFLCRSLRKGMGLVSNALSAYERLSQVGIPTGSDIAACQYTMAGVLGELGEVQGALELGNKALDTRQQAFGSESMPQARVLLYESYRQVAQLQEKAGNLKKALDLLEKLLELRKKDADEEAVREVQLLIVKALELAFQLLPLPWQAQMQVFFVKVQERGIKSKRKLPCSARDAIFNRLYKDPPSRYLEYLTSRAPEVMACPAGLAIPEPRSGDENLPSAANPVPAAAPVVDDTVPTLTSEIACLLALACRRPDFLLQMVGGPTS